MIAYISGTLISAGENNIVVDNNGIGYRIFVSGKFLEHIPAYGTQIKIYTHLYIREDEFTFYGFHSEEELSVFRILIGISGIGPKVAMAILTALTIQELQLAVLSDDVKTISKANGVGAKGASRIILELKDKLKIEDMVAAYNPTVEHENQSGNNARDAILALVNLGYTNSEAALAVKKIGNTDGLDTEQILKAALKKLI